MKSIALLFIVIIALSVILSACNVNKQATTGNSNVNAQEDELMPEDNALPNDIGSLDDVPVDDSIPE